MRPAANPLALAERPELCRISAYAQGGDYHKTVKKALKALARFIVNEAPSELKVFVDTAPVMEKPIAGAAGIGWQGKHSNLVSREHGSWLFLGVILTSLELEPDEPARPGTALRIVHPMPGLMPDERLRRAAPDRCPPLHLLSHDRARWTDPRRVPGCDWQSHLWLRRLSRSLPVEPLRRCCFRQPCVPAPSRAGCAAARRLCSRSTEPVIPGDVRRIADQANRREADDPQLPDRRR